MTKRITSEETDVRFEHMDPHMVTVCRELTVSKGPLSVLSKLSVEVTRVFAELVFAEIEEAYTRLLPTKENKVKSLTPNRSET